MEEENESNKSHIMFRLSEIRRNLKNLDDEDLKALVYSGKIISSLLGYPVSTLTSASSGTSSDHCGDAGRMLLTGNFHGMGEEFMDDASSIGGMGLSALLGFDKMSENLGDTAMAAMALGGFLGMALLPPPSMFGNFIFYSMALGRFKSSSYLDAKALPFGDNLEGKNAFLAHGPLGTSPAGNMMAILNGPGRTVMEGETSVCPGALIGFCGKYGFY